MAQNQDEQARAKAAKARQNAEKAQEELRKKRFAGLREQLQKNAVTRKEWTR